MKFMVRRTSNWGEDKPCDEAFQDTYVHVDERTTNDPAKIPASCNQPTDWWYSEGRNHRVEKRHIKRDFDRSGWFVEVNTLDEMLAFIDKHGSVVIGPSMWNSAIQEIEIYDGYRE